MSNQKDDRILEEYLKGKSSLSKSYRKESVEEPPAHLDAAIITSAKNAIKKNNKITRPAFGRWYVPLSLAAVVVITFSVVFKIYDEKTIPVSNKPFEVTTGKSADLNDEDKKSVGREQDVGKTAGEERYRDKLKEMEIEKEESNAPAEMRKAMPLAPESVIMEDTAKSGVNSETFEGAQNRMLESPATEAQSIPESGILSSEPAAIEFSIHKSDDITGNEITGGLSQQQWIELINNLWKKGKKESAVAELKIFIQYYPEYSTEQLKEQLPVDMDLTGIIQ